MHMQRERTGCTSPKIHIPRGDAPAHRARARRPTAERRPLATRERPSPHGSREAVTRGLESRAPIETVGAAGGLLQRPRGRSGRRRRRRRRRSGLRARRGQGVMCGKSMGGKSMGSQLETRGAEVPRANVRFAAASTVQLRRRRGWAARRHRAQTTGTAAGAGESELPRARSEGRAQTCSIRRGLPTELRNLRFLLHRKHIPARPGGLRHGHRPCARACAQAWEQSRASGGAAHARAFRPRPEHPPQEERRRRWVCGAPATSRCGAYADDGLSTRPATTTAAVHISRLVLLDERIRQLAIALGEVSTHAEFNEETFN